MNEDCKTKYPIGSQWECRDGSRAVVVDYVDDRLEVYKTQEKLTMSVCPNGFHEYYTPWVGKRTFEDEILVVNDGANGRVALYLKDQDLPDYTDVEFEREYNIIARMPFKITEGEGV